MNKAYNINMKNFSLMFLILVIASSFLLFYVNSEDYGAFPRSGIINGCRFDGFDCNDNNAGLYPGAAYS